MPRSPPPAGPQPDKSRTIGCSPAASAPALPPPPSLPALHGSPPGLAVGSNVRRSPSQALAEGFGPRGQSPQVVPLRWAVPFLARLAHHPHLPGPLPAPAPHARRGARPARSPAGLPLPPTAGPPPGPARRDGGERASALQAGSNPQGEPHDWVLRRLSASSFFGAGSVGRRIASPFRSTRSPSPTDSEWEVLHSAVASKTVDTNSLRRANFTRCLPIEHSGRVPSLRVRFPRDLTAARHPHQAGLTSHPVCREDCRDCDCAATITRSVMVRKESTRQRQCFLLLASSRATNLGAYHAPSRERSMIEGWLPPLTRRLKARPPVEGMG